ncbi:MAG TPA: manganese efflux pump MntP family protein [Methanocorpusculum sp.]|jgi:putative Mn2+ efflux pump MntP|nr:manganese efflux pump [Methanocorpusculum sp.]MEE1136774.1 manganese efflux pump MntP family protein [Methanocorpusculum sp.]HJJ63043.1 manganese efflux pump MntP family protein [Methanocorpusculum sp.]HJJ68136.1 manganese efflux pump MntP family protein [Methanocorpusculum sp.]HJJ77612.1 manganese efflux pump MntP family protein [Methanocorpusculum sp.]
MIPALFSTFAIAVGLAMDAFSVSLAGGAALKKDIAKTAVLTGLMFGFFQFAMPVIGWLVGAPISSIINPYGYWIVVALFFFIGGKMIYDAVKGEEEGVSLIGFKVLTLLAIATSIDALAVGISYGLIGEAIIIPSIIIGVVAFAFSFAGVLAGHKLSDVLGSKMEIFGGIVLVLIGLKFLVEIFI